MAAWAGRERQIGDQRDTFRQLPAAPEEPYGVEFFKMMQGEVAHHDIVLRPRVEREHVRLHEVYLGERLRAPLRDGKRRLLPVHGRDQDRTPELPGPRHDRTRDVARAGGEVEEMHGVTEPEQRIKAPEHGRVSPEAAVERFKIGKIALQLGRRRLGDIDLFGAALVKMAAHRGRGRTASSLPVRPRSTR